MAFISKEKDGPKAKGKKVMQARIEKPKVILPATYEEPPNEVEAYTYLLYGERKIGKSSLAAQFKNPFILGFEPVGASIKARKVLVRSWEEYVEYISLISQKPGYCDTVVIDNGNYCYDQCFDFVMKRHGIQTPKDLDGWDPPMVWKEVEKTFFDVHQDLFALGKSLIFTAHSEVKEFTKRDGTKYSKLTVQLSKQAFKYYASVVDVIGYFQYDDDGQRVLTIRGDATIEAGCRMGDHFNFTDGTPIESIPLGTSPKEAYALFKNAFNNKLVNPATQVKGAQKLKTK